MHRARWFAVLILVGLLAACGSSTVPTPSPDPSAPSLTGVTPTAAARGEAIVVTGTDFGSNGTLLVGGVAAIIDSWEATQIKATIADGTPDAWQEVTVTTQDGAGDFTPFFVGAEFKQSGAEFQEFLIGLPKGTAVLLQEQTYDLTGEPIFVVDNHGLFGRGNTKTTLKLPDLSTAVLTDFGEATTIADLRLEGGSVGLIHGTLGDEIEYLLMPVSTPVTGRTTRTIELPTWDRTQILTSFGSELEGVGGWRDASVGMHRDPTTFTVVAPSLDASSISAPAGLQTPRLTLRNVTYETDAQTDFGALPMGLTHLDLELIDVSLRMPAGGAMFWSSGNITLERVEISAAWAEMASATGRLHVTDSELYLEDWLQVGAQAALQVTGSTLRVRDGNMVLVGAAIQYLFGGGLGGGPIEINNSTLEALDADLTDGDYYGNLTILTSYAPLVLADNPLVRAHDGLAVLVEMGAFGDANVTLSGNSDIRVGVYSSEDATWARPARIDIGALDSFVPGWLTLTDNTISSTQLISLVAGNVSGGNLSLRGNHVRAGDGKDDGYIEVRAGGPGRFEMSGNKLTSDNSVAITAPNLRGTTAKIADNQLDVRGGSSVFLRLELEGGSCQVDSNRFGVVSSEAAMLAGFLMRCEGADPLTDTLVLHDNDLVVNSAGMGSLVFLVAENVTSTMDSNRFKLAGSLFLGSANNTASVTSNSIGLGAGGIYVASSAGGSLKFASNSVTYQGATDSGITLEDVQGSVVSDNTFTNVGAAGGTALRVTSTTEPVALNVTGNTFTNFENALAFSDAAAAARGMDVVITGNDFDFPIDAAPKAASLMNVKDEIDARGNRWGSNTDAATVEGYVVLSGDTEAQGGRILISPITAP